ncbi:MAG: MinD/ParA family ATP-binding protein [Candidatus Hodarchaeales archaeon]
MKVVAFHSYKGGTGKTNLSTNTAAILAKEGHKSILLDFDFRGPNLVTLFNTLINIKPEKTINDFLYNPEIDAEEIVYDLEPDLGIPLSVSFASTDFHDIQRIIRADKQQRQRNLKRILRLKDILAENFDYAFIDTSPGIQMESIDALVISDTVLLVLKPDDFDLHGTETMVSQLYALLDSRNFAVLNRVVGEECGPQCSVSVEERAVYDTLINERLKLDLLGAISCYCDLARAGSKNIFSLVYPDHNFTAEIKDLTELIKSTGV